MTNLVSRRLPLIVAAGALGLLGMLEPAGAQVVYAHPGPLDQLFAPYDEAAGTSPSFEISPNPYNGTPAVRVVERCQYPDGWNATDFSRDVNGTPAGIDHTCPGPALGGPALGGRVRARY